ncbi:MAG: DUF460 domain-containing protein [Candidatus Odinarchaeia archaeon]
MKPNMEEGGSHPTMRIIGLDIQPGSSPQASQKPKYAIAILEGDNFTEIKEKLSFSQVIKTIKTIKPDIVATDNLYELIPKSNNIYRFLEKIPSRTKIIQVTGVPSYRTINLKEIASKIGIKIRGKLDPVTTAKLLAILASKKIGFEILAFENETLINVSRNRRLGPGGWSQARLRRRLHSYILNTTREIMSKLKKYGIDFELFKRSSDFGLNQSKFIVNKNSKEIKKLIQEFKGPDIKVTITPIRKKKIIYSPIGEKIKPYGPPRRLIVGVDPGITTGLAILDLNGQILNVKSTKSFSKNQIIDHIYSYGVPILFASDTMTPSNFVIKLANITRSKIFSPKRTLSISEKQEIVSNYVKETKIKISNSHIRDALAAAIKAYQCYLPVFNKIEQKIKKVKIPISINEIKAEVILKERSVGQIIEEYIIKMQNLNKSEKKEIKKKLKPQLTPEQEQIKELRKQIQSLMQFNEQLKEENNKLKTQIKTMKEELKLISRSQVIEIKKNRIMKLKEDEISKLKGQIQKLNNKISELQKEIDQLKKIKTLEARGEAFPVKIVKTFSRDSLNETQEKYGLLKGDVIYLDDAGGGGAGTAEILIEKGVKAVITRNEMSHLAVERLEEADIPIIAYDQVNLKKFGEFYAVNKKLFEKVYSEKLRKLKERKEKLEKEKIKEIIIDYQKKRKKQLLYEFKKETELE